MTAVFRAHKGATPSGAAFAAHVAAVKVTAMSAHSKAIKYKKAKTAKPKKAAAVKKMSMAKYKAALDKQILASIKASQGLLPLSLSRRDRLRGPARPARHRG
jgi:hypothetical protein